jgi:hypothetical protein
MYITVSLPLCPFALTLTYCAALAASLSFGFHAGDFERFSTNC